PRGACLRPVAEPALAARTECNRAFFAEVADPLARLCHRMAERFARGGRLLALGATPAARSDARHVAVEFVHPVIVGKRALPALGVCAEGGPPAAQLDLLAEPDDIVMAFGEDEDGAAALRARFDAGGRLLALGNGGSATDAMDVVADFRYPPGDRWPPRRAIDLTEDSAVLTAIANDVGAELIFARQVIAHGRET